MYIVSKDEYRSAIENVERVYLFEIEGSTVYLRANIALKNNRYWCMPQVEQRYAALARGFVIPDHVQRVRESYCGKTVLSEFFGDEERAKENALTHFLNLSQSKQIFYVICNADELEEIRRAFPGQSVYVYVESGD